MLGQFCTLVMLYILIRKIYDSFIEANHQALKNVRKTNAIKDTITSKGSPARDCIVGSTFDVLSFVAIATLVFIAKE